MQNRAEQYPQLRATQNRVEQYPKLSLPSVETASAHVTVPAHTVSVPVTLHAHAVSQYP